MNIYSLVWCAVCSLFLCNIVRPPISLNHAQQMLSVSPLHSC